MALSGELGKANLTAQSIRTTANLTLDKTEAGWTITAIQLELRAQVPGATPQSFDQAAQAAKTGCPISRLLNTQITLDARLEP